MLAGQSILRCHQPPEPLVPGLPSLLGSLLDRAHWRCKQSLISNVAFVSVPHVQKGLPFSAPYDTC